MRNLCYKITSVLLIVLMLLSIIPQMSCAATSAEVNEDMVAATAPHLGDVNEDNKVNALDRILLTRYLVKPDLYKDLVNLTNADVDGYQGVTTRDRAVLTRYVAKWKGFDSLPPVSGAQTINYNNGDTVFVPDELDLTYDREEATLYYDNTISAYLTRSIDSFEEQRLANLCNGEVVGRIRGTINSIQIKVSPTHLDTLNNYAELLMNDSSVLFAIYDSPTVDEETVDQNPWRYDGKDEPTHEKGNEDNPKGNDWWAEAIGAYTAWRYTDSGFIETPASVGMMETGIDKDHEDLRDESGRSKVTVLGTENVTDHGAHVAGIMIASDNTAGIRGIADESSLIWSSNNKMQEDRHHTLNQMIDYGVHFINHSYGIWVKSKDYIMNLDSVHLNAFERNALWIKKLVNANIDSSDDIYEAYLRLLETSSKTSGMHYMFSLASMIKQKKDILMIESAGNNEGTNTLKNGNYCAINQDFYNDINALTHNKLANYCSFSEIKNHIMIVGAVSKDKQGGKYKLANDYSFGENVDIVAPGKEILSTVTTRNDNYPQKTNDGKRYGLKNGITYGMLSGTSMSAPMVTGSAALLKSLDPSLSTETIKDILVNKSSGTAVKGNSNDTRKTYPMLNVGAAAKYVMEHKSTQRVVSDKHFVNETINMNFYGEPVSNKSELYSKISANPSGTFYLTNDIDMGSADSWRVIPEFSGTLYGNGYSIQNLQFKESNITYGGMFRNISNAKFYDLGFDHVNMYFPGKDTYAGVIAAFSDDSLIENCYLNYGTVTATKTGGGFVAFAQKTTFKDLYTNVWVTGDATSSSNSYVYANYGGIAGECSGYFDNADHPFENCTVASFINANVNKYNSYTLSGGQLCVGGIVGKLNATTGSPQQPIETASANVSALPIVFSKCTVENGTVRGNIGNSSHSCTSHVGGLIGYICTDWGSATGMWSGKINIANCNVTSGVEVYSKGTNYAGGVIGFSNVYSDSGNGVEITGTQFNATIDTSFALGSEKCSVAMTGGMIGYNNSNCLLDSVTANGKIRVKSEQGVYAGKLIGWGDTNSISIRNYSTTITMEIDSNATGSQRKIGGLIGKG